jgi:hypothetical protein
LTKRVSCRQHDDPERAFLTSWQDEVVGLQTLADFYQVLLSTPTHPN